MTSEHRYLRFEFRTSCTRCGNPVVFDGPVEQADCAYCQHPHEMDSSDFTHIAKDVLEAYEKLAWKQGYVGTLNLKLHYGVHRMMPRCVACRTELDVRDVATGSPRSLQCRECGAETYSHPAPDWIRRALPAASQVFRPVAKDGAPVEAAPVTIHCPSCGGSLSVTTRDSRTITCQFCRASVYLPDDIWQRLHPVEVARAWFLRCDDTANLPPVPPATEKERKNRDHEIPQIPSGIRYCCYEPRTTCPACGTPLILNGPCQTVRCPGCQTDHDLPGGLWYEILEGADEDYHEHRWREGSKSTFNEAGFSLEVGNWRLVPRCSACRAYVDVNSIATGTEGVIPCRECGVGMPTFPAPAWLREAYPAAAQVFGADTEGGVRANLHGAGAPLTRPCPGCSAELDLTVAEHQAIACQSCGVDAFIPADLWRKLHPALQNEEWFVRFEGMAYNEVAQQVTSRPKPPPPDEPHRRPPPTPGTPPVRYVRIRNRTSCVHCGRPLMLNTLSETHTCADCRQATTVDADTWNSLLKSFEGRYSEMKWGQGLYGSQWGGQLDIKYQMLRSPPLCEKCNTLFDVADLPTGTEGEVTCTGCGARLPTWPVPPWLSNLYPSAEQVFGGSPSSARAAEKGDTAGGAISSARPVVLECDHCGATLRVGGETPRDVQCDMCGSRTFLPEGVWRRLHPARKVESWWIRLRGPTHDEIEATRKRGEKDEVAGEVNARIAPWVRAAWAMTALTTVAALLFGLLILIQTIPAAPYAAFGLVVVAFLFATLFQYKALAGVGEGSEVLESLTCGVPGVGLFFIPFVVMTIRRIERQHGIRGGLSTALAIQVLVAQLSIIGLIASRVIP